MFADHCYACVFGPYAFSPFLSQVQEQPRQCGSGCGSCTTQGGGIGNALYPLSVRNRDGHLPNTSLSKPFCSSQSGAQAWPSALLRLGTGCSQGGFSEGQPNHWFECSLVCAPILPKFHCTNLFFCFGSLQQSCTYSVWQCARCLVNTDMLSPLFGGSLRTMTAFPH